MMRTVYKEYFNTVFDYYFLGIISALGSNVIIRRIININLLFYLELLIFIILKMIKEHSLQQFLHFSPLKLSTIQCTTCSLFRTTS